MLFVVRHVSLVGRVQVIRPAAHRGRGPVGIWRLPTVAVPVLRAVDNDFCGAVPDPNDALNSRWISKLNLIVKIQTLTSSSSSDVVETGKSSEAVVAVVVVGVRYLRRTLGLDVAAICVY